MKHLPENAYTFRTTSEDSYITRVVAEADPTTNFLIVVEDDKATGERTVYTLVRKHITALSLLMPELTIDSVPLGEFLVQALGPQENQEFVTLGTKGDRETMDSYLETVEQDIRHIKNIITNRQTQVTVQSF